MADYPPLEIVRDRPTDEKPEDRYHCPMCDRTSDNRSYDWTTLMAGGDGTWNGDINHTHSDRTCPHCQARWMRHTKDGKVWYTSTEGELLRGFPACYESSQYHCATCNGAVRCRYERDGQPATTIGYRYIEGQGYIRDYDVTWYCVTCGDLTTSSGLPGLRGSDPDVIVSG